MSIALARCRTFTGARTHRRRAGAAEDADRVLAAVLFTDIVNSTGRAVEIGDRRWRELLDSHDRLASVIAAGS